MFYETVYVPMNNRNYHFIIIAVMKIESNWKIFERTFYVTFILKTLDKYIDIKLQNVPS